ncbi:hypothetical protein FOZ62_002789 [Perkinsus olseni]|uniref:Uncharacterized protein n=1 Tax=Perkinsus olseni TaxID=32597 RepID=A0A7J6RXM8_PEROL|nr:hypothetical protein FOZ62_002789 [Perkinsus olseni]
MAFRFRREGDRIKHRMHEERMGMRPWIRDFKWRVFGWHYEFYMGNKARQALLKDQKLAPTMQVFCDLKSNGVSTKGLNATKGADNRPEHGPLEFNKTKYFTWRPCIPNIVPYRKSTSPFCKVSSNTTGWTELQNKRIPDPVPKGWSGHNQGIGGTDESVPIHPQYQ